MAFPVLNDPFTPGKMTSDDPFTWIWKPLSVLITVVILHSNAVQYRPRPHTRSTRWWLWQMPGSVPQYPQTSIWTNQRKSWA